MGNRAPATNPAKMSDIAAIILAAGMASRFRAAQGAGGLPTKLIASFSGKPLVRHVAEAACASRAHPIVVVTGHAQTSVEAALHDLPVQFTHNAAYATGLASSLRTGVAALPADVSGTLILLADMPRITPSLLDRLIAAFRAAPTTLAIVPTFEGQRGNPVLIAQPLFARIKNLEGDIGARALLRSAGDAIVEVAINEPAVTFDVDTPDILAQSEG